MSSTHTSSFRPIILATIIVIFILTCALTLLFVNRSDYSFGYETAAESSSQYLGENVSFNTTDQALTDSQNTRINLIPHNLLKNQTFFPESLARSNIFKSRFLWISGSSCILFVLYKLISYSMYQRSAASFGLISRHLQKNILLGTIGIAIIVAAIYCLHSISYQIPQPEASEQPKDIKVQAQAFSDQSKDRQDKLKWLKNQISFIHIPKFYELCKTDFEVNSVDIRWKEFEEDVNGWKSGILDEKLNNLSAKRDQVERSKGAKLIELYHNIENTVTELSKKYEEFIVKVSSVYETQLKPLLQRSNQFKTECSQHYDMAAQQFYKSTTLDPNSIELFESELEELKVQDKKYTLQKQEIKNQKNGFRSQFDGLEAEFNTLKRQLESNFRDLEKTGNLVIQQKSGLELFDSLEVKLKNQTLSITTLETSLAKLKDEVTAEKLPPDELKNIQKYQQELEKSNQKFVNLYQQYGPINVKYSQLLNKAFVLLTEISEVLEKIAGSSHPSRQKLMAVKDQLEKDGEKIYRHNLNITSLSSFIFKQNEILINEWTYIASKVNSFNTSWIELKIMLANEQNPIEAIENKLKILKKDFASYQTELNALKQEWTTIDPSKWEEIKGKPATFQARLFSFINEITSYQKRASTIQAKLKEFKKQREEVKDNLRKFSNENKLKNYKKDINELEIQQNKINSLIQEFDSHLTNYEESCREIYKYYYNLLDVSINATPKEINRAYRKLSLKYHPDKGEENSEQANEKFREIANAKNVLLVLKKTARQNK